MANLCPRTCGRLSTSAVFISVSVVQLIAGIILLKSNYVYLLAGPNFWTGASNFAVGALLGISASVWKHTHKKSRKHCVRRNMLIALLTTSMVLNTTTAALFIMGEGHALLAIRLETTGSYNAATLTSEMLAYAFATSVCCPIVCIVVALIFLSGVMFKNRKKSDMTPEDKTTGLRDHSNSYKWVFGSELRNIPKPDSGVFTAALSSPGSQKSTSSGDENSFNDIPIRHNSVSSIDCIRYTLKRETPRYRANSDTSQLNRNTRRFVNEYSATPRRTAVKYLNPHSASRDKLIPSVETPSHTVSWNDSRNLVYTGTQNETKSRHSRNSSSQSENEVIQLRNLIQSVSGELTGCPVHSDLTNVKYSYVDPLNRESLNQSPPSENILKRNKYIKIPERNGSTVAKRQESSQQRSQGHKSLQRYSMTESRNGNGSEFESQPVPPLSNGRITEQHESKNKIQLTKKSESHVAEGLHYFKCRTAVCDETSGEYQTSYLTPIPTGKSQNKSLDKKNIKDETKSNKYSKCTSLDKKTLESSADIKTDGLYLHSSKNRLSGHSSTKRDLSLQFSEEKHSPEDLNLHAPKLQRKNNRYSSAQKISTDDRKMRFEDDHDGRSDCFNNSEQTQSTNLSDSLANDTFSSFPNVSFEDDTNDLNRSGSIQFQRTSTTTTLMSPNVILDTSADSAISATESSELRRASTEKISNTSSKLQSVELDSTFESSKTSPLAGEIVPVLLNSSGVRRKLSSKLIPVSIPLVPDRILDCTKNEGDLKMDISGSKAVFSSFKGEMKSKTKNRRVKKSELISSKYRTKHRDQTKDESNTNLLADERELSPAHTSGYISSLEENPDHPTTPDIDKPMSNCKPHWDNSEDGQRSTYEIIQKTLRDSRLSSGTVQEAVQQIVKEYSQMNLCEEIFDQLYQMPQFEMILEQRLKDLTN